VVWVDKVPEMKIMFILAEITLLVQIKLLLWEVVHK
jgi:hypothetical protein